MKRKAERRPTVAIVQRQIPHYRVPFFRCLRDLLERDGIDLCLVEGTAMEGHLLPGDLEGVLSAPTTWIGPLMWNNFGNITKNADLIVIPQQVKQLDLFLYLLKRRVFPSPRIALWGHGKTFQSLVPDSATERVKRFVSRRVDWWFAYNDLCKQIVAGIGFPADRITSVGNSIDTIQLTKIRNEIPAPALQSIRSELGITSENVAVYTGGYYSLKRIPFLIDAAIHIRKLLPDFHLLMIGSGPERTLVTEAARLHPWIHDLGPKRDTEKVPYWAISKVSLMPGGVGLVVLDSFALGVPMVTTDTHLHGPEIDYLNDGVNGLLVPCGDDVGLYAEAVVSLLKDETRLSLMRNAAIEAAKHYSIEHMAENFARGVRDALAIPDAVKS